MSMAWARRSLIAATAMLAIAGTIASSASALPTYNYSFSFGAFGYGGGELFNEPVGLTTTSTGDVYVADNHNHRIAKWSATGAYLGQFGTANLWEPRDISIDSKGNRWVVDYSLDKIVKFNSANEYVGSYGEFGSGNGQLWNPTGLAIDTKDNIWVNDYGNQRLMEFNSEGKYVRQINKTTAGHELTVFKGIATDSSNNVWIVNSLAKANKLEKFNSEGKYLSAFAVGDPWGITIDAEDDIWVADQTTDLVKAFNTNGELLGQFGEEEVGGVFFQPYDIAFDANGNPWVINLGTNVVRWLAAPSATTDTPEPGLETTLKGKVNPHGTSTSYQFEYGLTTAYGTKAPTKLTAVGSGTTDVAVSKVISVPKETTYHYRTVATNTAGSVTYGKDVEFFTGIPAKNTSPPVISPSTPTKGVLATTTSGTWTGTPAPTFAYRWERCSDALCTGWTAISGAKSSTYTPVAEDVGHPLRSVVTGRNGAGVETVKSSPTGLVKP